MYKIKRRITALILAVTILAVNTISAFADIDKSALSSKYYDTTNEDWADNGYLNPSFFDSYGNAYDESAIPQFTYDSDGNITGANDAYYNDRFNDSDLSDLKGSLTDEEYENYIESFDEYPLSLIDFDSADALSDSELESDVDTHFAAAAAITVAGLALCAVLVTAATGYVFSKADSQSICEDFETHLRVSGNSVVLGYLVAMISAQSLKDKLTGFGSLVKSFKEWWSSYVAKTDAVKKSISVNSNVRHNISYSAFSTNFSNSKFSSYTLLFSLDVSNLYDSISSYNYQSLVFDYIIPNCSEILAISYNYSLSKGTDNLYSQPLYCYVAYKNTSGQIVNSFGSVIKSYKNISSLSTPNPTWVFGSNAVSFGNGDTSSTSNPNRYKTMCEIFLAVAKKYNVPFFLNSTAALNYAQGKYYDKECLYTGEASLTYNNAYKLSGDYDFAEDYSVASDDDLESLIGLLQSAKSEAEAISFIKQYLALNTEESATSTAKQRQARWEYLIDCFAAAGGVTDYDYATVTTAAAKKLADDEDKIINLDTWKQDYDTEIIEFSEHVSSSGSDKDPKKNTHYIKKAIAAAIAFALGLQLTDLDLSPDNINIISDSSELPNPDPSPSNPDPDVDLNATNNILMKILSAITSVPAAIFGCFAAVLTGIADLIKSMIDLLKQILTAALAQVDAITNLDLSSGSSGDGGGNIEESGTDSDSQNILKGFVYIPFLLFVLLIIFINCMRLVVSIFNIQASTDIFNAEFIQGFDYIKSVQLPLFNITLYQLLIGGCYFCLLCSVIRVLRKRIDSIHS